jgi:anthranilate phosphoribosyltransferase
MSSSTGSADVLEALGFQLEQPPDRIARSIDELGFGFMFAQIHHPAMRHAAAVRRELGTRTVFNVLGPLTNPAGTRSGVFGVFSAELVPTYAGALAHLEARHAFVVHGAGGIDELSPTGPNVVCEVVGGAVRERILDPRELGIEPCAVGELEGGGADENADAIRRVFEGQAGARSDAVALNAAAAIVAAGLAGHLREGLATARETIESGAAGDRLEELREFSHG